jgi:hypothetical protein
MKKASIIVGVLVGGNYSARSSTHKVIYMITGDPSYTSGDGKKCLSVGLTYTNSSGGSQQEDYDGCEVPFEIEVEKSTGNSVYMSAQLNYETENQVHVSIIQDGKLVIQKADSTGAYSIATASGIVQ